MMSVLKIKRNAIALVVGIVASTSSFSAEEPNTEKVIADKLTTLKINVQEVSQSPVKGLYEVQAASGLYYVTEDAKFLFNGEIYDLDNRMANITKIKAEELRKEKAAVYFDQINELEKDMIIYKAEDEKHVVTVFTDTSCGYCQKLHSEMEDYNKAGITIRYLAFPRGGLNSNTYRTMVSVWCADDPKAAMDQAKLRRAIAPASCENTVKEQYELGILLGVKGTPSLFLEDGSVMPGYLPADRLLQVLEEKK